MIEHIRMLGTARDDFAAANVGTCRERERSRPVRLSTILSEIWRESENLARIGATESLP
jgi:hypothetical protein